MTRFWPGSDNDGKSVTESQFTILKAAECSPSTPAIPRQEHHHEMVAKGVKLIVETEEIGRRPA